MLTGNQKRGTVLNPVSLSAMQSELRKIGASLSPKIPKPPKSTVPAPKAPGPARGQKAEYITGNTPTALPQPASGTLI